MSEQIGTTVALPPDDGERLNVMGERIAVRAHDPNGGWVLIEVEKQLANRAPPHAHPWAEIYYFLTGGMGMRVGEQRISCTPGMVVSVPPGVVHAFLDPVLEGTRFLSVMTPAKAVDFFRDIDREIPPGPPDLAKVAAIAARHGLKVFPHDEAARR
jgi:quercetin dioxygenase-like cupin family protein